MELTKDVKMEQSNKESQGPLALLKVTLASTE